MRYLNPKTISYRKLYIKIASSLMAACLVLQITGCTKDINLKLSTSASNIVIEGNITNAPGPYIVTLSQSQAYYQTNVFPPVSGATVIIGDNAGNTDTLQEAPAGTYTTHNNLGGVPGRTYNLTVINGGQTYKATSTMPTAVSLDSLSIQSIAFFGNGVKFLIGIFPTSTTLTQYYREYSYQNRAISSTDVTSNQFNDRTTLAARIPTANNINTGDTITVYVEGIDEGVYNYFNSLQTNTTNSQTVAPANPTSNISNGALGYFCAGSIASKVIIAP